MSFVVFLVSIVHDKCMSEFHQHAVVSLGGYPQVAAAGGTSGARRAGVHGGGRGRKTHHT